MVEMTTSLNISSSTNSSLFSSTGNWTGNDPDDNGETTVQQLGYKNQTLFVSLVVMGIIVPAIFIFVFTMICMKHRRTQQSRRSTMLLRNGPEVPIDDIPLSMRTNLENGRL